MVNKRVVVLPGDDAAPEAVAPALKLLKSMRLGIEFVEFPPGEQWVKGETEHQVRAAIDASDSTLFGATSGKTGGIGYLRWGKQTYANVRPARWVKGFRSPLARPEGLDFVIVRENLEDLYMGVEGPLENLAPLKLTSRITRRPLDTTGRGVFAVKVITERNTRRVAEFACRLALERQRRGAQGKVTCACKYNMLAQSDGLFREVVEQVVSGYSALKYEQFIVDDFARRLIADPYSLDVVVMPNLYGDILSDAAAGLIGGLGLAPSGCYGEGYAYFESVHGTAPDIRGQHVINPTATILSAVMMLEYLGLNEAAWRLREATYRVYAEGRVLTRDQGGTASSEEFGRAIGAAL